VGGESKEAKGTEGDVRELDVNFRIAKQERDFKEHLYDIGQHCGKSLQEMQSTTLEEYLIIFAKYFKFKRDGR
jgi:hypothetical protein